MTDYEKLTAEIRTLRGFCKGIIGSWEGVRFEAWQVGEHGIMIATKDGGVGIYQFVGADQQPVDADIAFVRKLAKTPMMFVNEN